MKIKQRNFWMILYGIAFSLLCIFIVSKSIIANSNHLLNISGKEILDNLFFMVLAVGILVSSIYGSYIELKGNLLIRIEGFLKKKFLIEKITKIYCAHHVVLGPSMFLEYKDKPKFLWGGFEHKLLVLNQYRDEDKKTLLDFLAENYPNIEQDHNCEKIRNGEKVLTIWRDK